MRINHNMLAINTHRQLGGVALAQAKSMEKLSSGYRINRAGDDAAGLAISEKMRAQIRGLNTAAKNAQDGISLIQTGEGALQEVHSMLNRMVELATQSANGTYDDKVDRKNLQSELEALQSEVNRVAESANFNGIKLLDGSLGSKMRASMPNVTVNGVTDALSVSEQNVPGGANGASVEFGDISTKAENNKYGKLSLKYNDKSGKEHRIDFEYSGAAANNADVSIKLDGKLVKSYSGESKDLSSEENLAKFAVEELNGIDEFSKLFTASVKDGEKKITVKANEFDSEARATMLLQGTKEAAEKEYQLIKSITISKEEAATVSGPRVEVDTAKMTGIQAGKLDRAELEKGIISVDGEKFAFVKKGDESSEALIEALEKQGVKANNIVVVANPAKGSIDAKEVKAMANKINEVMGEGTVQQLPDGLPTKSDGSSPTTATATTLSFSSRMVDKGKGLTLQVGDSAEDFQKITVRVNDMSSKGLGIDKISVATSEDAAKAIASVKDAINKVSSARGDMGALQNRLEHTIANINTTAENITASESRIRDVDMAKEMVELTRANILQQAAQAMLAQANQAPQGVLGLLR